MAKSTIACPFGQTMVEVTACSSWISVLFIRYQTLVTPVDLLDIPPGSVAVLISIVLGFLALFLEKTHTDRRRLTPTGSHIQIQKVCD
jgi:hypothetical protein